jgi:hypothetical protein
MDFIEKPSDDFYKKLNSEIRSKKKIAKGHIVLFMGDWIVPNK